jgi:hypothetical protein
MFITQQIVDYVLKVVVVIHTDVINVLLQLIDL